MCSENKKIVFIIEYYPSTLSQEIERKQCANTPFTCPELITLYSSIIQALKLQKQYFIHNTEYSPITNCQSLMAPSSMWATTASKCFRLSFATGKRTSNQQFLRSGATSNHYPRSTTSPQRAGSTCVGSRNSKPFK
jgi:hypothetical protein